MGLRGLQVVCWRPQKATSGLLVNFHIHIYGGGKVLEQIKREASMDTNLTSKMGASRNQQERLSALAADVKAIILQQSHFKGELQHESPDLRVYPEA